MIGTWALHGSTVFVTELTDPSGVNTRYTFQMTLTLRSRPLGRYVHLTPYTRIPVLIDYFSPECRWNRLDFAGYDSVNMESGEAIPLALKHERSFWFSKVRSYS